MQPYAGSTATGAMYVSRRDIEAFSWQTISTEKDANIQVLVLEHVLSCSGSLAIYRQIFVRSRKQDHPTHASIAYELSSSELPLSLLQVKLGALYFSVQLTYSKSLARLVFSDSDRKPPSTMFSKFIRPLGSCRFAYDHGVFLRRR